MIVQGAIINPNNSEDVRYVKFTKVYGGFRDDSEGSRYKGKILTEGTIQAIIKQYPTLEIVQ